MLYRNKSVAHATKIIVMAKTSIKRFKHHLTLLLFLLFTISAYGKMPPLFARLIHRDSIESPFYTPASQSERANRELRLSTARAAHLLGVNDYRAGVIPEKGSIIFMANLSIGEPPIPQLLMMDTGSNIVWVQCLPCTHCYKQSSPLYDPSKSSTYVNVACRSHICLERNSCPNPSNEHCDFSVGYLDGTTSKGTLGYEKFTLKTSDDGIASVENFVFGCGHDNEGVDGQHSGILGLGALEDELSLVHRLGSKFSYCLGNVMDHEYAFNNLILGDTAKIEGTLSPLDFDGGDGLYYVALEGISVGEKKLEIDPSIFKRSARTGVGGVIIDSGASLTFLAKGAFDPLSIEVESLLNNRLKRIHDPNNPRHLCYQSDDIKRDINDFPIVTFHFNGGAVLELDVNAMFYENGPNEMCVSVVINPFSVTTSIIGVTAQQFYNVAYDLVSKTISFFRIDCRLLEA